MNQIELNKSLYEECCKKEWSKERIQELINNGANPLGAIEYRKHSECVYGELVYDSMSNQNIYDITKIFLENGMKIDHSKYKNDEDDIDPLWKLTFRCDKEGIRTLKLLLDYNTDWESIEEFVEHTYEDYWFVNDMLEENYTIEFDYAIRMMLLCASYQYVFEKSERIRRIIDFDKNNYDMKKFREYSNYLVEDSKEKCVVIEKQTGKVVWKIKYSE